MQLIQRNRFFTQIILLIIGTLISVTACDNSAEEFEKNGPSKQESRRVIVDVNVFSTQDKTRFEALFYYDIAGMVDGKEVSGFQKEVIKIKNAKLDDIDLKESKDKQDRIIYTAEIPKEKKEYKLTFAPNDNLESTHKINLDPIYIDQEIPKLEKSKIHELKLSREATSGELPAIVEITKKDDFLPARIEYLKGNLFFNEDALKPFPAGKSNMRVRFETIPNTRDNNKSIRYFNYLIETEIEIIE